MKETMQQRKAIFAKEVMQTVCHLCSQVFNAISDVDLERRFGISCQQMEIVIQKIIDALPYYIFDRAYPHQLEEIKNICAREFIFFQVQEKCNDPSYQEDLSKFINIFCRDIERCVMVNQPTLPEMKEGGCYE